MPQFNPLISPFFAMQLGEEAVEISERGCYHGPNGRVDISSLVRRAVETAVHYDHEHPHPAGKRGNQPEAIEVTNESTFSAHRRNLEKGYRTVSLNFANAITPGGGFLRGARAQEEYLCRSSALFHTIDGSPMYKFNRLRGHYLYSDAMTYSPYVPVFRGDDHQLLAKPFLASFITSPAPLATKLSPKEFEQLPEVFRGRIHKVLSLAQTHNHEAVVLGAWGCGAFGNDGHMVAKLFREALRDEFAGAFRQITFAIADVSPELRFLKPFSQEFGAN